MANLVPRLSLWLGDRPWLRSVTRPPKILGGKNIYWAGGLAECFVCWCDKLSGFQILKESLSKNYPLYRGSKSFTTKFSSRIEHKIFWKLTPVKRHAPNRSETNGSIFWIFEFGGNIFSSLCSIVIKVFHSPMRNLKVVCTQMWFRSLGRHQIVFSLKNEGRTDWVIHQCNRLRISICTEIVYLSIPKILRMFRFNENQRKMKHKSENKLLPLCDLPSILHQEIEERYKFFPLWPKQQIQYKLQTSKWVRNNINIMSNCLPSYECQVSSSIFQIPPVIHNDQTKKSTSQLNL